MTLFSFSVLESSLGRSEWASITPPPRGELKIFLILLGLAGISGLAVSKDRK